MPLFALAETAYAIPSPTEPAAVPFNTLVANGVLCGLPEHAARDETPAIIADESTTATAVAPCHGREMMVNGYHDCCCIKTTNDLAAGIQEGPVTDALGEAATLHPTAIDVPSTVPPPLLSRIDAPEPPPPSLI